MFPTHIIHRIALYVKQPKIVKLLMHQDQYNKYVIDNEFIYDELLWQYTKLLEYYDDIRIIQSIYRQKEKIGKYYIKQVHAPWSPLMTHREIIFNYYIPEEIRMNSCDQTQQLEIFMNEVFKKFMEYIDHNVIITDNMNIFRWLHRTENDIKINDDLKKTMIIHDRKTMINHLLENKNIIITCTDICICIQKLKFDMMKWLYHKMIEQQQQNEYDEKAFKKDWIYMLKYSLSRNSAKPFKWLIQQRKEKCPNEIAINIISKKLLKWLTNNNKLTNRSRKLTRLHHL